MAKVLVVDDSKFMRSRCEKVLVAAGYTVVQCENGLQGVENYQQHHPEIVLLDVNMPIMDGIEALQKILVFDSKAVICMMTAAEQMEKIKEALSKGAKYYILKPFEEDKMTATIAQMLQRYVHK